SYLLLDPPAEGVVGVDGAAAARQVHGLQPVRAVVNVAGDGGSDLLLGGVAVFVVLVAGGVKALQLVVLVVDPGSRGGAGGLAVPHRVVGVGFAPCRGVGAGDLVGRVVAEGMCAVFGGDLLDVARFVVEAVLPAEDGVRAL